jgi:CRISPR/Cas system CMR-associated protein Cmr5 small subunit
MTDNFLKYELEAEAKTITKRKRITLIVSTIILLAGSVGTVAWAQSRPNDHSKTETLSVENESFDEAENRHKTKLEKQTELVTQNTTSSSQSNQAQATPQTYTPTPQSINKAAYISDANKVMANYNQIVELITFSGSMSNAKKASRIKQAVALDKQSFSQVTALRGHLVWADVSSGPYMEATKLAESGVSKISVGLDSLEKWANDSSRINDYNIGNGLIAQGANILLRFSNKVDSL